MKIVAKDNYDRESKSEFFVCENVVSGYATRIVDLLNLRGESRGDDDWFYVVVADDYALREYDPNASRR